MNCSVVQVHRLAMRSLISLSAWETSISSLVTEVWDVRLSLKVTNFKTDYVWKNLRTICLSSALSPLSDRGWSQDSRVLSVRLQRNMRFSPDQSKNSTNQSVTVSPCDLWIEEHASGHNWSEIEFLDLCVGPQRCSMLNLIFVFDDFIAFPADFLLISSTHWRWSTSSCASRAHWATSWSRWWYSGGKNIIFFQIFHLLSVCYFWQTRMFSLVWSDYYIKWCLSSSSDICQQIVRTESPSW